MLTAARAGTVGFLHYGDTGNLGDLLCSPRHYFDFESDRPALIVGGGASNNFFCGRARKQPARVRIAWGIGQSWPFGAEASALDRLFKAALRRMTYARASTRDPFLASDALPLVPCVSVFHPVAELPAGNETGIFLNSNEKVSGAQPTLLGRGATAAYPHAFVATNALEGEAFLDAFARAGTIVTNSYHAAYWGLLSGRRVHIIGYSSKFTNLAALFGYSESVVLTVQRGDADALDLAIARSAECAPLALADPARVRSEFRALNLGFARGLAAAGVFASLKPEFARAR